MTAEGDAVARAAASLHRAASPIHRGETELLIAAAGGDRAAVRWLIDEVAPTVYGFIYARVGGNRSAADDILQDTLLESVRSAAGYKGEAALSTWICAIARRRLARYYEAERRAEVARSGLHLITGEERDPTFELEQRDEVVRALGRLSAVHRQVLVMKYLDGQPVARIGEQLGRSRVQVQSLLQRARDALRRELEDPDA